MRRSGTRCMRLSHQRCRVPFWLDPRSTGSSEKPWLPEALTGAGDFGAQGTPPGVWVGMQELFSGHQSGCPEQGWGLPRAPEALSIQPLLRTLLSF